MNKLTGEAIKSASIHLDFALAQSTDTMPKALRTNGLDPRMNNARRLLQMGATSRTTTLGTSLRGHLGLPPGKDCGNHSTSAEDRPERVVFPFSL